MKATYVELRVDDGAVVKAKNSGIAISAPGGRRLDREPLDEYKIKNVMSLMSELGFQVVRPPDSRPLATLCSEANEAAAALRVDEPASRWRRRSKARRFLVSPFQCSPTPSASPSSRTHSSPLWSEAQRTGYGRDANARRASCFSTRTRSSSCPTAPRSQSRLRSPKSCSPPSGRPPRAFSPLTSTGIVV